MEFTIFLTTECNFECKYCYENCCTENYRYMSKEMIVAVIEHIFMTQNTGLYNINFFGGEPTLVFDIIRYAVDCVEKKYTSCGKIEFSINTNGSRIDSEMIDYFCRHDFSVKISLDGNKYYNNLNRKLKSREDVYEKILHHAVLLNQAGVKNSIRMTVTENTVAALFENFIFLYDCGFRNINIGLDFNCIFEDKDLDEFAKGLNDIADFIIQKWNMGDKILVNYFSGQFDKFVLDYGNHFNMCGGGITSLRYMPDGKVYPCNIVAGDEKFCIGDVWRRISVDNVFELIKGHVDMDNNSKCLNCQLAFYCHYMKCGYMNCINTGYFNKPSEIACKTQKITYPIVNRVFEYVLNNKIEVLMPYIRYAMDNNFKLRKQVQLAIEGERKKKNVYINT